MFGQPNGLLGSTSGLFSEVQMPDQHEDHSWDKVQENGGFCAGSSLGNSNSESEMPVATTANEGFGGKYALNGSAIISLRPHIT